MDGTGNVDDVQINGTSIVEDGVANVPLAGTDDFGVVKVIGESYGIASSVGRLSVSKANDAQVQSGTNNFKPIVPSNQHSAAFYGLAKASGDETQLQSANPVGVYTDYAKGAIQNMLDVPSNDDVVNDVRINGSSIVENGVANVPIANGSSLGVVRTNSERGIGIHADTGRLQINSASVDNAKAGGTGYLPITPYIQHASTFYGLAKAAGDTSQSQSSNAVGNYTEEAKDKIQTMLGVSPLIAPHETDPFESNHVVGELFIIGGKLYRAKTALTAGEYVNEGTNVEVVNVAEVLDSKVGDVQIDGTSITQDGVANIPIVTSRNMAGAFRTKDPSFYITNGDIRIDRPSDNYIQGGIDTTRVPTISQQHKVVFYGLAKIAGHDEKNSTLPVGTYTPEAKSAIKQMLSIADNYDSFIVDVEGTDPTITGQPSYRYNCGEVLSLTVTPPETGTIDIRFTSGSSPTVLTLPSTVKMPEWWVEVEANTVYEMCITDGVYCGVMSWAI